MTTSMANEVMHSEFATKLAQRQQQLSAGLSQIGGMQSELVRQKAKHLVDLSESQDYLDQKEHVRLVLKTLHERSVESVKVLYEDLLTGLLRDIFPDDSENHKVHLNLHVKRNQSALSIDVSNRAGYRRDVFLDKGGSVKSIIAIGLRFIALARSRRRRLVVLDEADSELNPRYIPRFAGMMHQLSSRIGMQVIYISHHDYKSFEGSARIIRLARDDMRVYADTISDLKNTEIVGWKGEEDIADWMEDVGLTDIRLFNVKQHENTHIELSPLVNVIVGDNDVGKSTVVQAIDAVARNNPREKMIRDDEREMRVEIGIEHGKRLFFRYRRSGQKKTAYLLYNKDNEKVKASEDGNNVPEWLHTYLGMELFRGFDLHIGMQGNVDFLLDPSYSDAKRAEILSLNSVSGGAQRMISLHTKKVDQHQKRVTEIRKQLSAVKYRLSCVGSAFAAQDFLDDYQKSYDAALKIDSEIQSIESDIAQFTRDRIELAALSKVSDFEFSDEKIQALNQTKDIDDLLRDIESLERLESESKALKPVSDMELTSFPVFDTTLEDLIEGGKEWAALEKSLEALKPIYGVELADVPDKSLFSECDEIEKAIRELETVSKEQTELKVNADKAEKQLKEVNEALEAELKAMGPICVTCNQPIDHSNGDHSHD